MHCSRFTPVAVPNAVLSLTLLARTKRSVTVTWNATAEGRFSGYIVTLAGGGKSAKETLGRDTTTIRFTGLSTGTKYTIRVVVVSGDQKSRPYGGNFYTGSYKYLVTISFMLA